MLAPRNWKSEENEHDSMTTSENDSFAQSARHHDVAVELIKEEPSTDPESLRPASAAIESIDDAEPPLEPQDPQLVRAATISRDVAVAPSARLPRDADPPNPSEEPSEVDEVMKQIKNTCPFCDRKFVDAYDVETHVMYSHRKTYCCSVCKRSFSAPKLLEEHQQRLHGPDFFLECSICHIKYKSEEGLRRHRIRAHSDAESKFTCDHCGRSYKLKPDLQSHVKRHMFQPQMCRFCGKTVKDIKNHEWRHQKRNGELKYAHSCHLCRKKFLHKSRLENHLKLHEKGFKCDKCGKEYAGTTELKNHQRKHGPPTVSTCTLCHKEFTSISNFHQHVLTHAGIRPYKCDICDEDFTQRSSLLRHRRSHPGPLPSYSAPPPQIAYLARRYLQRVKDNPDAVLKCARL